MTVLVAKNEKETLNLSNAKTEYTGVKSQYLETSESGTRWFHLSGICFATGVEFNEDDFGITTDNVIVDHARHPLPEGDIKKIAFRINFLNGLKWNYDNRF